MKVIIAGSRTITDYSLVEAAIIESRFDITHVISGGASGVDSLGERWAKEHSVPLTVIKADWDKFGRMAGPTRNLDMARKGNALIAIWDGQSKGTSHMISVAKKHGLMVYVKRCETPANVERFGH